MKILLIGSGGREHALAWKLAQSPLVSEIHIAPGNAGTALEPKCQNISISDKDIDSLLDFAKTNHIDLTIVGPELPLSFGIVDLFTAHDLVCFGPSKAASQLETSKSFCKQFAKKYQIPTANSETFTNAHEAKAYIKKQTLPIVIKADGLAGGKGVVIAYTLNEAFSAIDNMLVDNQFGEASKKVIIETFLAGEEASYFVIADGKNYLTLTSAQDHKARDNGDKGPNTGGMGAYSPAPLVDETLEQKIIKKIIEPTLKGMAAEKLPYQGFLFAGIMVVDNEPYLLEYNCRMGDPETQSIMMRLETDLLEIIQAASEQKIDRITPKWNSQYALNVVMCAEGYPMNVKKGDLIHGLNNIEAKSDYKIFHAGTKKENDKILTNGGRVLSVVSLGTSVAIAKQNAYHIVKQIHWSGALFRTDIGYKAL